MPAETDNSVTPAVKDRSVVRGDVPEPLRRRYYLDEQGGAGLAFYADATVKAPAFRDRGRQLVSARTDPNAIRDMMAIARHRRWTIVTVRGAADFRREAWLAGRSAGLEVRGYCPTERDLQDIGRRTRTRDHALDVAARRDRIRPFGDPGAKSRMAVVSAVVRDRVGDRAAQDRILAAARARIADWLERGVRFEPLSVDRSARGQSLRSRGPRER